MRNNKQFSSVEWLISQLQKSKDWNRVLNEISQMSSARVDIIEQAKAMHREEIDYKIQKAIEKFEEAKNKAYTLRDMVYLDGVLSILDTIKNETFGGNNEQQ